MLVRHARSDRRFFRQLRAAPNAAIRHLPYLTAHEKVALSTIDLGRVIGGLTTIPGIGHGPKKRSCADTEIDGGDGGDDGDIGDGDPVGDDGDVGDQDPVGDGGDDGDDGNDGNDGNDGDECGMFSDLIRQTIDETDQLVDQTKELTKEAWDMFTDQIFPPQPVTELTECQEIQTTDGLLNDTTLPSDCHVEGGTLNPPHVDPNRDPNAPACLPTTTPIPQDPPSLFCLPDSGAQCKRRRGRSSSRFVPDTINFRPYRRR